MIFLGKFRLHSGRGHSALTFTTYISIHSIAKWRIIEKKHRLERCTLYWKQVPLLLLILRKTAKSKQQKLTHSQLDIRHTPIFFLHTDYFFCLKKIQTFFSIFSIFSRETQLLIEVIIINNETFIYMYTWMKYKTYIFLKIKYIVHVQYMYVHVK